MRFFGKGKCNLIANFSAAMVTSLSSHSLPSLSLSLSLSYREYLTHNIGSASALPIINRLPTRPNGMAGRARLATFHCLTKEESAIAVPLQSFTRDFLLSLEQIGSHEYSSFT